MPITRLPTPDELQKIAAAGGNPQQYANTPLTFLTPEEQAASQGQQQSPGIVGTIGEHAVAGVAPGAAFMAAAPSGAKVGALIGAAIPGVGETGISEGIGAAAGGLISGSLASWAAYKAQHAILDKVAPDFTAKMDSALQQGADEHPIAAVVGDVLGNWPSAKAELPKLAQLPFRAAVGGGIGVAMPLLEGRAPNWQDVASGAANASIFGHSRFGGEPAPEVTNNNENSEQQKSEEPVGEMTTRFTKVDENGDYTIGSSALKPLYMKQFAEKVKGITDPILKAEAQTRNEKLSNLSPSDMRQQLHLAAMNDKAKEMFSIDKTDSGLENAEDTSDSNVPWQEPSPEVTNATKVTPKDTSIEKTEDTSQASPAPQASANAPVLPKVNPVVEEAKARDRLAAQDNTQPKTPAELAEEQFLTKGNLNAPPSEDSTKPKFIGTQKGAGNIPDTDYYNLVHPIMDSNGQVIHGAGSTVSEHTLRKYGIDFDEKGVKSNKFDYENPNEAQVKLAQSIHNGSQKGNTPVTLGDALQFLVRQKHPWSSVFKDMLNSRNAKLNTPIIHDPSLNDSEYPGVHRQTPSGSEIALPTDSLLDVPTILHEGIHALEHQVLPTAGEGVRGMFYLDHLQKFISDPSSDPHAVEMTKAYLESVKQKGLWTKLFGKNGTAGDDPTQGIATQKAGANYGYTNVHEFSAHKFDPEFQSELKSQKWGDTTVWRRIMASLQKFLGVHDGTMFDRLMQASKKVQRTGQEKTNDYVTRQSQNKVERTNKFLVNGAELVKDPIKLGLRPNSSGAYNGTQLLGTLMNKLSPMEQEIYKSQGIEQYFSGRTISQADAVKWMEEHSPKAETHTYGMEGKVSEAKKEYDKMTHEWYETLDSRQRQEVGSYLSGIDNTKNLSALGVDITKAARYKEVSTQSNKELHDGSNPKATSHYNTVSALPTNEPMPEWTKTKSGKNVQRVDVVIPNNTPEAQRVANYVAGKRGAAAEGNLWQPDNLHENLPNTLGWAMIQYKTGPNGEKIAVIAEAQSRWGQEVHNAKQRYESGESDRQGTILKDSNIKDHPLLRDYNRLILKAAIEQARKEGATHIMVSDAETAMMTEGHDAQVEANRHVATYGRYKTKAEAEQAAKQHEGAEVWHQPEEWNNEPGGYWAVGRKAGIPQEPGMRLNYDTILPKIAEELTGSKGERVSLGEHKNAYVPSEYPDGQRLRQANAGKPRENLIFRKPDGTPKTDVSGRMYKLDSVPDREPMLYGKRYAMPKEKAIKQVPNKDKSITPDIRIPFGGKGFMDAISRARETAPKVADAFHSMLNARQQFDGDVYGKVKVVMNDTKFNQKDGERLMEAMRYKELNKRDIPAGFFKNNAQRLVWNKWNEVYKQQGLERIKDKQPVIDAHTGLPRLLKADDNSYPLVVEPKVRQTIRDNTDAASIQKLKDEFFADRAKRGISKEDAQQQYDTIVKSFRGNASSAGSVGNLNNFNANRRAQGIPLPDSWTRQDFEKNLQAFSVRNAADRAHFKYIESNPEVMAQLGETKDAWNRDIKSNPDENVAGNPHVHALIESAHGELGSQMFHNEKAASSLFTALDIASPALSGVHIPIANTVGMIGMVDNPIQAGRALFSAISNWNKGLTHATENGVKIVANRAADVINGNLTAAERMQAIAGVIRKVSTFNDLITKGTVGFGQSFFESLIPSKIARANSGDVTAQQWLRSLEPSFKLGVRYDEQQMNQMATRALGYIHGTSDARTMPAWMLHDTEVSGFMSLAHWSVGQTNRFIRDVYTPATQGNYKPLMMSLFGSVIGGYIIKELREQISGKKSTIPSLEEIGASDRGFEGNKGAVVYNMIAAMQYAGFAGLFSQIAKYPFDAAYKNNPQGATFPLDEILTDTAKTGYQVATAIANDPNINWVDMAKAVGTHLMVSNFRLGREAYNQAINAGAITGLPAEKKELSDKMGQLRRFDMVEGLPYNEIDEASNPYMNVEQKSFKMEQDPQKAMQQLPSLVQNIMETYHDKPDVMMSKLKSLKENQYSTFPSMENMPLSFMKYVGYLQRMEGPEAAQQELQDFMKHKVVNEAKASVIP
jgi:hypothetical protein